MIFVVVGLCQNQNTLFGPHDTSRVSESDLHPFPNDGNLDTSFVLQCNSNRVEP